MNVQMELVSTGMKIDERTNSKEPILFVRFTTDDGREILYPWENLRETIKNWIEIEKNEINTDKQISSR